MPVLFLLFLLLAACAPQPLVIPTRAVLPTASPSPQTITPIVIPGATSEQISPPEAVTQQGAFLIITPTPPPSKTATDTETPTITLSPSPEPTDITTAIATHTALIPPTSVVPFVTAVVVKPVDRVCDSTWFFAQPHPEACPATRATISQAVYQEFQYGFMIWIQQEDQIYVMYNLGQPAWELHPDQFEEGMPEIDEKWESPPTHQPYQVYQPRRGFGTLWRSNGAVRARIGWSLEVWETPYSASAQVATDGTIFVDDPDGGVFALLSDQEDWQRFHKVNDPTEFQYWLLPTLTPTP